MNDFSLSRRIGRSGPSEFPLVGSTLTWMKNPTAFALQLYEQYGPIVDVNICFRKVVYLLGVEANESVLIDGNRSFSNQHGWFLLSRLFAGGLMLQDFDEHRVSRQIVQRRAFTRNNVESYLFSLRTTVETQVNEWNTTSHFACYKELKSLMLKVAISIFLGVQEKDECSRLNEELTCILKSALAIPQWQIPGLPFWRGMKSREFIQKYLASQIENRRNSVGTDLFTQLCIDCNTQEVMLSREAIVDQMIFLIMAAHDTTASLLSSLTMKLAEHQEWQNLVRAELGELRND